MRSLARSLVCALTAAALLTPGSPARALGLAAGEDASASAPAEDPGLTSADPGVRVEAGRQALRRGKVRTAGEATRARAIGESLLRDFPGTEHAVAGLSLIFAADRRGSAPAEIVAVIDGVAARVDALEAEVNAPTPALRQAIAELRGELLRARGTAHLELGRAGDPVAYLVCADTFQALFVHLGPTHPRAPEALWGAANCSEAGSEPLLRARPYYELITLQYAESSFAEEALAALIDIDGLFANFAEQAAGMERYAARYAKSQRTPGYLRHAATIRLALGPKAAAEADLVALERLYARKDPEQAARAHWARAELATTDAGRKAHAEDYLRRYGKVAVDRRIVAEATIAAIEWRSACPGGDVDGLCLAPLATTKSSTARSRSKSRRCAEPTTPRPRPRTAKLAEAAGFRFAAIAKLARLRQARIPADDLRRITEFHDAVELSRLADLDRDLEAYMTIALPTGLRFEVDPKAEGEARKKQVQAREASMRRLHEHLAEKEALARKLLQGYDEIRANKRSVPATLAAAQRTALIYEHYADQLLSAEIPRELAGKAAAERAFCGALADQAAPLLEHATAAYSYCADRAVTFQFFTDASRACEAALVRLDRMSWPPLLEYAGEPAPAGELPPRSVGVQFDPPRLEAGAGAGAGAGE